MEEYLQTNDATRWIDRVSFTQLPPSFNNFASPWRVSSRVKNYEAINKLLAHSLVVQSSTISTASDHSLHYFIRSNCCLQISSFVKYYLSFLNVEVKAYCGALTRSEGYGLMHAFLEIENEIVDNTYNHISTELSAQKNFTEYFNIFPMWKVPHRYDKRPPSETTVQFDEFNELEVRFSEITCKSDLNMRKSLASTIRNRKLGIGALVYDKLMRHWIKTELGVEIPCVTELMDQVCWCCGKNNGNEGLKKCTKCNIAKYCNRECQKNDWRAGHKLMHEMIERGNSQRR